MTSIIKTFRKYQLSKPDVPSKSMFQNITTIDIDKIQSILSLISSSSLHLDSLILFPLFNVLVYFSVIVIMLSSMMPWLFQGHLICSCKSSSQIGAMNCRMAFVGICTENCFRLTVNDFVAMFSLFPLSNSSLFCTACQKLCMPFSLLLVETSLLFTDIISRKDTTYIVVDVSHKQGKVWEILHM
jgi:hypothetical protein